MDRILLTLTFISTFFLIVLFGDVHWKNIELEKRIDHQEGEIAEIQNSISPIITDSAIRDSAKFDSITFSSVGAASYTVKTIASINYLPYTPKFTLDTTGEWHAWSKMERQPVLLKGYMSYFDLDSNKWVIIYSHGKSVNLFNKRIGLPQGFMLPLDMMKVVHKMDSAATDYEPSNFGQGRPIATAADTMAVGEDKFRKWRIIQWNKRYFKEKMIDSMNAADENIRTLYWKHHPHGVQQ